MVNLLAGMLGKTLPHRDVEPRDESAPRLVADRLDQLRRPHDVAEEQRPLRDGLTRRRRVVLAARVFARGIRYRAQPLERGQRSSNSRRAPGASPIWASALREQHICTKAVS
jgi:hypothetical protein